MRKKMIWMNERLPFPLEMNVLASPYYLEYGGTVIDWVRVEGDETEGA